MHRTTRREKHHGKTHEESTDGARRRPPVTLRTVAPGARWPLAVNPSVGLGVRDLLRRYSAWTPPPYAVCAVGNDCAARGEHFLSVALEELLATPNAYGLLAYVFLRPTREVAAFAANAINVRPFESAPRAPRRVGAAV